MNSIERKGLRRLCKKSNCVVDGQEALLKTLTVKSLIDVQHFPNRKFAKGERRNTWVAISYHHGQFLGYGVFVRGKVRKDEFLVIYRGNTKEFRSGDDAQPRPRMGSVLKSSSYVLEFTDEDGVRYVVDGRDAEVEHGSIGHFTNSVSLTVSEDLEPCRFEWDPNFHAFVLRANYDWDSGEDYVELRVSYGQNEDDVQFWSDPKSFQTLPKQDKQVVLDRVKTPIVPMVTRQDYSKNRAYICNHALNCKKAKNELRKIRRSINLNNLGLKHIA